MVRLLLMMMMMMEVGGSHGEGGDNEVSHL